MKFFRWLVIFVLCCLILKKNGKYKNSMHYLDVFNCGILCEINWIMILRVF